MKTLKLSFLGLALIVSSAFMFVNQTNAKDLANNTEKFSNRAAQGTYATSNMRIKVSTQKQLQAFNSGCKNPSFQQSYTCTTRCDGKGTTYCTTSCRTSTTLCRTPKPF